MAGLGRRSHYRKHLTDAVLHDLPEPDESIGQRVARVVGTRGGNMFDVVVAPPSSNKEVADAVDDSCRQSTNDDEEIIPKLLTTVSVNGSSDNKQAPIDNIQRRTSQLAFLPTKFRKLVWIKRNDFVIVECGEEESEETQQQTSEQKESSSGGGFRYVITHILYKDQVKHIKSKDLWPLDPFFADSDAEGGSTKGKKNENEQSNQDESNDDVDNEQQNGNNDTKYDNNGIVFDDPLGDELLGNTNRLATLCVDSSSEEESDDD